MVPATTDDDDDYRDDDDMNGSTAVADVTMMTMISSAVWMYLRTFLIRILFKYIFKIYFYDSTYVQTYMVDSHEKLLVNINLYGL